jgi:hypothetical protein
MGHSERQRRRAHSQETPKIEERSFVAALLWMTANCGESKALEATANGVQPGAVLREGAFQCRHGRANANGTQPRVAVLLKRRREILRRGAPLDDGQRRCVEGVRNRSLVAR